MWSLCIGGKRQVSGIDVVGLGVGFSEWTASKDEPD
jgi:hypothetical protein